MAVAVEDHALQIVPHDVRRAELVLLRRIEPWQLGHVREVRDVAPARGEAAGHVTRADVEVRDVAQAAVSNTSQAR